MNQYEMNVIRGEFASMRFAERLVDYSRRGRVVLGGSAGFNMLSIKPANDTEEFYRATAKFNQGGE